MSSRFAACSALVAWVMLMPPADGPHGYLKVHLDAALSEWNFAGRYANRNDCEKNRLNLRHQAQSLPIGNSRGLKPLAIAEANAKCVASDDSRAKGAIPEVSSTDSFTEVPYLRYPDENSTNYRASDAGRYLDRKFDPGLQASFPRPSNETRSPNGRYVIRNVADGDAGWSLSLTDTKANKKNLLYKYDRSVEIVWSPFSDIVVLNDYFGSDMSQAFLLDPASPDRKIDLAERLAKSNRPLREKLSVQTADHIYPHVTGWVDRDHLIFVTMGHDGIDAEGFTISYLYNVRNNSFELLDFDHHSEGGGSFPSRPQAE